MSDFQCQGKKTQPDAVLTHSVLFILLYFNTDGDVEFNVTIAKLVHFRKATELTFMKDTAQTRCNRLLLIK